MKIQDMNGIAHIEDMASLEKVLYKRYGSEVNAFWLSHESEENNVLLILVNNELSSLHFFPPKPHPGFQSLSRNSNLNPAGFSIFYMNNPLEKEEITNTAVVPFSDSLKAAQEFFLCNDLPKSISWLEL